MTRSVLDDVFLTDVDEATEIVLVRHGQQHYDRSGPVGSWVDPPLSVIGRKQARALGRRLAHERVDVVYASPLARALDTAVAVATPHGLTPIQVPDLREIEVYRDVPADKTPLQAFGRLMLLGARHRFELDRRWDSYPASESSFELRRRVSMAIEGIIAEERGKRVVVACHGGVINAYVAELLGLAPDMFFRPAHTSMSVVRAHGTVRAIQSLNDVGHLVKGGLVTH